ncbi:alpha/beta hydrolase [Propionicicella superfundia]|uniref:alpha/beta hydrolase n=1 Tax=Propionicicella superfundia TaxID=348582 RepID=UPI000411B832|nr:alpha/beta-hydrolase family protein [Propionicicella superfundia]
MNIHKPEWLESVLERLSPTGLTFSLWLLWVALAPSLIAREWWMTMANVALCMSYGYLLGVIVERVALAAGRWAGFRITLRPGLAKRIEFLWNLTLAIITLVVVVQSVLQQQETARLVGMTLNIPVESTIGTIAGVVLFVVLLGFGRLVARLWGRLVKLGGRYISPASAAIVGTLLITLVLALSAGGAVSAGLQLVFRQAQIANEETLPGRSQPTEPERSGSPDSPEHWSGLGAQGQAVVSDGPRAADITAVTGAPAKTPIRVYAGLVNHNDSLEETAAAVVAELYRTKAFDRAVLAVMTGAGKGWIQEWNVASVEYLTNGDCATASMQYSYTLSPFTYVSDPEKPKEAGKLLFDKVYAEWLKLPVDQRPKLVVGGESLGAYGGTAAFESLEDMTSKVDGAVWVGTPSFTALWQDLTAKRRTGSPEIAPVIDNGRVVRFVNDASQLSHDIYGAPYDDWGSKRVIFVQHPSDPIVWWSWDLLWREPDWLREPLGSDVVPAMSWRSWASFWQLAADMAIAQNAAPGHGHTYHEDLVPVWAAALGQDFTRDFSAIEAAIRAKNLPR